MCTCVVPLPDVPCRAGVFIGQTPSETVAKFIALQAGVEGSDLLRGGLTHTVVSARWCPASRSRVMRTWEVSRLRTVVIYAFSASITLP